MHKCPFYLESGANEIILFIVLLSGAVGTARLYLKAHNEQEIYGGYVVGILSQMIAYRIFF